MRRQLRLRQCELAPELAWRINVEGVQNLLSQTVPRGVRLVHLSCDLVFSGADGRGGYVETDPTDPVTVYGRTMVAGEEAILAAYAGKGDSSNLCEATLRAVSRKLGPVPFSGTPASCGFRCRWASVSTATPGPSTGSPRGSRSPGRPRSISTRSARPPTPIASTGCASAMLGNGLSGIFHAGGPRRLTLYQIAQIINRVGGYDPDCLMGIPRRQAGPIPPRAGNVSMDSSKLKAALGCDPFTPWPYCETLVPTHPDWHRERPPGEPRSPRHLHRVLCTNPARRENCLHRPA